MTARTDTWKAGVGGGGAERLMALGAPAAALLTGFAAEWLDFRTLRYPLLLMVGLGVLATALALLGRGGGWRAAALTVAIGVATWAAAETVYVVLHAAQGERFEAERFGPQPLQALGLIVAHGVFLGAPTGVAAAIARAAIARATGGG